MDKVSVVIVSQYSFGASWESTIQIDIVHLKLFQADIDCFSNVADVGDDFGHHE